MADRVDVQFSAQIGDAIAGIQSVRAELETLGTAAEALKTSFAGMGEALAAALAVDKIAEMASEGLKLGEALETAAQQTGATTEQLQVLKFQGDLSNVSFDTLTRIMARFSQTMQTAQSGAGPAAAAFQALGIQADYLKTHSNDLVGMITTVAQRLDQYADGANKSAIETAIFGQRGGQLIPFLSRLSGGLDEATQQAREAGAVLGDQTVSNLADGEQAVRKFDAQWSVLKGHLAETFTPGLTHGLELLNSIMTAVAPNIDADIERVGKLREEMGSLDATITKLRNQVANPDPLSAVDPAMQLNVAIQRRSELLSQILELQQKIDYYRPPKAASDEGEKPAAPSLPNEADQKLQQKIALENQRAMDAALKQETHDRVAADDEKYATDKAYYDRVAGLYKTQYQLHQISLSEETQGLTQAEDERYQRQVESLNATLNLYGRDEAGYEKTLQEVKKATIEHARALEQINGQAALKMQQQFEQIARPIESSFGSAVTGMLLKTQTLQQGLASIGQTIVSTMVGRVIQYIVDEWIIAEAVKLFSSQSTAAAQLTTATTAAAGTAAIKKTAAVSEIMADAAVAAAGAAAAVASIPFIGPGLAPEAAAATFASTSAWAGAVAAEGGMWNVPGDEFPILAHAGESVLPADIAGAMRDFFTGGASGGGHTFNTTVNVGGSNASPDAIARALGKALRNFTLKTA
jgi:hypothetical protein